MLRLITAGLTLLLLATVISPAKSDLPPEIWSIATPESEGRFTVSPSGVDNLGDDGYTIGLVIMDINGDPFVGIPRTDMWVCADDMSPCPGIFSQADYDTDITGNTTFSGPIYSGLLGDAHDGINCDETYLYVYALGIMLNDFTPVMVSVDSPDLDGDRQVSISDFAKYSSDFNCASIGVACDPCHDYNFDGQNTITDFAIFCSYFNRSFCP
ncbi:MAG: hypothetical protein GY835_06250 [bacterium]|nr:hypothetical protein [bacterium]